MPSDQHDLIMAMATGLIFSLFDVTSAQEVPFGIPQYIQCILHGLTSLFLCVALIFAVSKSIDLVVARDSYLCITEIIHAFQCLLQLQRCFLNSS